MDSTEETVEVEQQVRRTRSGRAIRTSSSPAAKISGRKKKKMVLVEVEVSDEEESEKQQPNKSSEHANVELENSNNAVEVMDVSDVNEYINSTNTDLENSSNAVQFFEDSNNVTTEPNTFTEAMILRENNVEVPMDTLVTEELNLDNSCIEEDIASPQTIQHVRVKSQSLFGDKEPMDNGVACPDDDNAIKPDEDNEMDSSYLTNTEEFKNIDDKSQLTTLHEDIVEEVQTDNKAEIKLITKIEQDVSKLEANETGDTEVISEDELPGVQVAKVPETEEVSDEELPGPKRAELPADTEVVSEDELPTVKKEGLKRKLATDDYDPGSPTSENESAPKKPSLDGEGDKEKEEKAQKPKKLPELDKYWKAVNDDPTDFTGWTYLLQYVDQENDMEAAREAYDAFLSHYPYCYGYWRKYADYEKRKGNKKKCEEVFERGLKAIPLSVDLWIHYLTYVRTTRTDDEEFIRSQFERALAACGLEFRSDRLWDGYIKWESEGKRYQQVTAIYDRLLSTPTQGYTTHFDNFQEHIASHPPNKVLEVDEFLALRKEVKHMLKHDVTTELDAEKADVPPGEDDTNEIVSTDEETKVIRERIVSIRRKIHKNTVNAVTARWNFEEGIKRPYFHVKPLERCQLKNWQDYLDFEIEHGDETRIVVLFERCLIACALYEEFWLKFVHYLENLKDSLLQPKIKDVYERACTIHHLKKPNLHLQWAIFEESMQNYNRAAEILVNLEKSVPNILQIAYRRINLERRRGDYDKCCQLFEHYINISKNKMSSSTLAIKFARFYLKVMNNIDKGIEVLNAAITKDPNNARLSLQLVDFTLQKPEVNETEILSIFDAFLEKEGVDNEQKILFSQRKLEFLEDFGSNIEAVQKAQDEFQKYIKMTKENKKKDLSKMDPSSSKKDKNPPLPSSQSNSYGSYGNYANSSNSASYNQYSGSQQPQYNYSQYGQNDQYQYQNWQYSQGNYSGYNQWGGYSGGGYGY